jgi:hypothetical protein
MDNSMATRPYSTLKGDPYRAYEELPAEVRRALQESLVDWCPLRAREWHLHLLRRQRLRPAQAASLIVQAIRRQDQAEVAAFARTWPKGAEAYPHLAAGATLQRYAGPDGIPAAAPVPVPPTAKRFKAAVGAGRPKAVPPDAVPRRGKKKKAGAPPRAPRRKPARRARR